MSAEEKPSDVPGDPALPGDPTLDFLSLSFDPVKALQSSPSKVLLPHPSVQPCDNLQAYTSGRFPLSHACHMHVTCSVTVVVEGRRQAPRPHTATPQQ